MDRQPWGRARDFAIHALDLWQSRAGTLEEFKSLQDVAGNDEDFCPAGRLFRNPGCRLRGYRRLLGDRPPLVFQGFFALNACGWVRYSACPGAVG
ncbi:MAG: hypothetical protein RLZZ214_3508 [Verrucomicrobiota bacterium]|jgi:hypothetical protein